MQPKVHIYAAVDANGGSYERMRAAGLDVQIPDEPWSQAANRSGASTELVFAPPTVVGAGVANRLNLLTRRTLESAPGLRLIAKYSVGYDNVDEAAATDLGILVVNSPTESNWGGVAEGAVTFLLSLFKKVRERDRSVKDGLWRDPSLMGTYLGARLTDDYPGIAVGIIGLGRIGSRVADLLAPWRVRLLAYDPYAHDSQFVSRNVRRVSLDELLSEADAVTIHCNLTPETRGMIGERELGLMKPGAVLINSARGPIVDIDALFDALQSDRLTAAALDVLPEEPPQPQTPLLGLGDKVLLSPHMISNNVGTGLQMAVPWVEKAIFAAVRGEVPENVVNPDAIPLWRQRFAGNSVI